MRSKCRCTLLVLGLIVAIVSISASSASAQVAGFFLNPDSQPQGPPANPTGQARPGGNGIDCTFVDFEGVGDQQPVGTVAGVPQVTFGDSWLGVIDADAGGMGNFANEPSPDTATSFLDTLDPITFDTGVQYIELYYVASAISLPVTLTAWDGPDGTGNVVGTSVGNTVGTDFDGANCSGDPTGQFCLWDLLSLAAAQNNILSITLEGAVADQFGFDNMLYCTAVPVPAVPSYRWTLVLALLLLAAAIVALRVRFV